MDWYVYLKDFQTAIAALLGFTGVILTIRRSAIANKDSQNHARDIQLNSLRVRLLAELELIGSNHKNYKKSLGDPDWPLKTLLVPNSYPCHMFNSSMDQIGLLRVDEATAVIRAYAGYENFMSVLEMIKDGSSEKYPGHALIITDGIHGDFFHAKLDDLVHEIDQAVDQIIDSLTDNLRKNRKHLGLF